MDENLNDLLLAVVEGRLRAPTKSLVVLPAPPGPAMAIVGVPGIHVVASSAAETWVREQLAGDLMGPLSPAFVVQLAHKLQRVDDGLDVVFAAPALHGKSALRPADVHEHPRVARAGTHRVHVNAYEDRTGEAVVVLGRGLAMRHEVAVEVAPSARGRGLGRQAFYEARRLIPDNEWLFAQVAPANAASSRALISAGFTPIGAEVLFFDGPRALT